MIDERQLKTKPNKKKRKTTLVKLRPGMRHEREGEEERKGKEMERERDRQDKTDSQRKSPTRSNPVQMVCDSRDEKKKGEKKAVPSLLLTVNLPTDVVHHGVERLIVTPVHVAEPRLAPAPASASSPSPAAAAVADIGCTRSRGDAPRRSSCSTGGGGSGRRRRGCRRRRSEFARSPSRRGLELFRRDLRGGGGLPVAAPQELLVVEQRLDLGIPPLLCT